MTGATCVLTTDVGADITSSIRNTVFIEFAQELPCDGRDVQACWVTFQSGLIEGAVCTFVIVEVGVVLSEIQCVQHGL